MTKDFILLFNLFALLIYKAFFTVALTATYNMPDNLKAGNEYTVDLVINKGPITGFAKFQQELPAGVQAVAVETKGGSFSFVDNTIKIIWMSLPSDPDFKVTYKVTVAKDAQGTHALNGKFSYIENNEKKVFNLENRTVTISSDQAVAKTTEVPANTTTSTEVPTTTTSSETNQNQATSSTETAPAGNGEVSITRTITKLENNEFNVVLNINKGSVSGFAKLEETLPAGTFASSNETENAVFSFVDQKAKFLWMSIPSSQQFKVSYKVKAESNLTSAKVEGLFSYLVNDATQKYIIKAEDISLTGEAVATNNADNQKQSNPTENTSTATNTATEASNTSTAKTTSKDNSSSSTASNNNATPENTSNATSDNSKTTAATNVAPGKKGVNYRVQIIATHKNVEPSTLKSLYSINDPIIAEMHEGWHKYTVGGYNEYKAARDKREAVSSGGVQGPFVTAYNNGSRITVQEALMITTQKWIR